MTVETKIFPQKDYPTRELLEPLMVEAGFGTLPDKWEGTSEAMFMPEMLVEIMKHENSTDILFRNKIVIEEVDFRDVKKMFYFYTRWAGLDNKIQSLVFRLISLIGKQPKYFYNHDMISLTIEEKYYYAILVRLLFDNRNVNVQSNYAPVFSILYIMWQERWGEETIPTVQAVKNLLEYNEELFSEKYNIEEITSESYEIGIFLSFDMLVEDILYVWQQGIPPEKIKFFQEMGFNWYEIADTAKNMPDEWYSALA